MNCCKVAARASPLSRVQVDEVLQEIREHHPDLCFETQWVATGGDQDRTTSLRHLDKTDFFTKEVDDLVLSGTVDIGIHSAKDLPDPLPKGLYLAALTKGVDPSDSLAFRQGESLATLPQGAKVGTSSLRREEMLRSLRPDLTCVDIRGTIEERLKLVDDGVVDALIVAEAALLRLGLHTRSREMLPFPTAAFQGQLAIICREEDLATRHLFAPIDSR